MQSRRGPGADFRVGGDPFVKGSENLVARLGDLARPHWDDDSGTDGDEGFLVMRNRNRKSNTKRKWMFGLCPAPPHEVIMAATQRAQEFLESVLAGSAKYYFRPRRADTAMPEMTKAPLTWEQRKEMGSVHQYTPNTKQAQLCLAVAALQSLARHKGSSSRLQYQIERRFLNHYRDLDQRLRLSHLPRALLEECYRDFIRAHPDCNRLRRNGRLDMKLLDRNAAESDPGIKECRDLFSQYLRKAWTKREATE